MASKLKVQEVVLQSPNGLVEKTMSLDDNSNLLFDITNNLLSKTGKILQVVQGKTSTEVASANTTYIDTGLSVSITPTFSNSKILVFATHGGVARSATIGNSIDIKLLRNSTELSIINAVNELSGSNSSNIAYYAPSLSMNILDTPNTTSQVTYKTQFHSRNGTSYVTVQWAGSTSTIIAIEIGV